VDNIEFDNVDQKFSHPRGISQRIPIKYIDEDGKTVNLCIATPELMAYGIQKRGK